MFELNNNDNRTKRAAHYAPRNNEVHSRTKANTTASDVATPEDETKPKKKSKGLYLGVRIASGVFAVIFAVFGVGLMFYSNFIGSIGYQSLNSSKNNNSGVVSFTGEDGQEYTIEQSETPIIGETTLLSSDSVLNIMLFGADRYGNQGLSDTMILLSIDNAHKKIKMTSFLRDTFVSIPGYYSHKLNLAYSLGSIDPDENYNGAGLSIRTIESNYGIKIDRYATVNFSTFMDIVNILGGVELYVTSDEIGYINAQVAYNGQSDYLNASEGMVTLNGQQALWYARNRGGFGFAGDDWDRTSRQRNFLNAVIENVKGASLSELVQIVNKVGPNITTNLKKTEIEALLARSLTFLEYEVEQCSMPSEGTWGYDSNYAGSIIRVNDWNAARRDLAKFIYEEIEVE